MKWQVNAKLYFDIKDEAADFFTDCKNTLPKATVVNPCLPNQECSRATLVECFHDDMPHENCEVIQDIDNCPECPE